MAPIPAATLETIVDALFNPGALTMPLLGRLPPPTHPGALAHPIPGHTGGASVTPRDNAVVASRDNNDASVTLHDTAVAAAHNNDPATPTHPDALAHSAHTWPHHPYPLW